MFDEIAKLKQELTANDRFYTVFLDALDLAKLKKQSDLEMMKAYVTSLGYSDIGQHWQKMDVQSAFEVLVDSLYKGQAYPDIIMPFSKAAMAAARYIGCFDDSTIRCYANYSSVNKSVFRDSRLTNSTFERSIVFIDQKFISLLIVADED